jgi:hypothetical protein
MEATERVKVLSVFVGSIGFPEVLLELVVAVTDL